MCGSVLATCSNLILTGKKKRRIRRQIRALPKGCVLLAEDETDVRLFPPLRAAWTKRGEQARVWLSGRNALRVIFGAINLRTGHRVLLCRERQYAADFCTFLDELRRRYRDRPLALLLDADSSHTARASLRRAAELDIRLIWLPTRSPELNPMEHLWRAAKQNVSANRQDATIERAVERFLRYVRRLTPRAALRKAGVLSRRFWLRGALSK
jgi:transposase